MQGPFRGAAGSLARAFGGTVTLHHGTSQARDVIVLLLIIGHGRHGKDSVGDILRSKYGMRAVSSSEFAAEKAVFPLVSGIYPDWRAAYEDRHAHRDLWFHAIRAYNLRPGPSLIW